MDISLNVLKNSFAKFLHRYHAIIFVVFVVGGLAVIVFMLNTVISKSSDTSSFTDQTSSSSFDTATIKRLDELKTTNEASNIALPSDKRINPFVE